MEIGSRNGDVLACLARRAGRTTTGVTPASASAAGGLMECGAVRRPRIVSPDFHLHGGYFPETGADVRAD
eukprot:gene19582-39851_t